MNRITTSGELTDGKDFTVVVTRRHVVVRVQQRVCISHPRAWFDTDEAYALMGSLAIALRGPQPESDIQACLPAEETPCPKTEDGYAQKCADAAHPPSQADVNDSTCPSTTGFATAG